jgi:hypothetical protein
MMVVSLYTVDIHGVLIHSMHHSFAVSLNICGAVYKATDKRTNETVDIRETRRG